MHRDPNADLLRWQLRHRGEDQIRPSSSPARAQPVRVAAPASRTVPVIARRVLSTLVARAVKP
jgi:hypothetical protein